MKRAPEAGTPGFRRLRRHRIIHGKDFQPHGAHASDSGPHGGVVTEPPDPGAPEIVARFRDPAGNQFAIYQERSLTRG